MQAVGETNTIQLRPLILDANMVWNVEPEDVLHYHPLSHSPEILNKWRNLLNFESTLESLARIRH